MVESLDPSSDRAEKAARAKDRLKKFQAKKRAKESVNPSISSSDPISNHTPIHPSPSTERFDLTDDRFSVGSDPTDGGPIVDGNDDKINHTPPDRTRLAHPSQTQSTVSKLSPSTEIPKSFKDSQIVLSESDGVSKIVDPKDSSQRQTIALLVNEKSVLNDQLESYRKRVEDLNHDIEKHQNALTFQMNFSNEELENSKTSINNLNSQLLDSNNLITALRQELDRKRSELQDLNQSQSNGTEEVVIRDYEAKLRMKQNHSDAVESELSRLKDLIKSQDDQSREQAGALDQLNRVIKGLRNDLDLKDQSSTSLSSQLEDLRILRIDTQNELSSTQSQLQESQSELLKLRSHTDSTRSKLSCLQDSYDSLSSKLPLIEKQLLESNSRRDSLQRDNQSLLANLEELRIKTVELTDIKVESGERLEESKKLAQDRNELLLIKDQELREQRQAQELEKQTFEQHIITLRGQVEDQDRNFLQIRTGLDEEIEKNRQCLNSLASQLQDSQLQLSQSLQKLQDAQKAQEDSEARNDILETEKSKLEAQNFDRDQSLRLSNDEAERLRDQIELLAKDLDLEKGQRLELEKQKLQTRQELESLRSTTVEQSAKLDDYEKTVEGKLNLLEQANDRVSKLESQNRDLSQSLSSSDSRVESLQAEFKDAQKCLREHQVTLQSRIDEIREKSNLLESASKKISELEGALELAKVDSKDLSDKFDKAKLEHKKQFNDYSQRLTETEARAVDELGNSNMRYQELQIFSESLQAQLNQSHADREEMKNRLESLESELLASQRL
ncbi:hypothetical protein BY996DRAFT_1586702 [Phakopsora pachyrhizi]|nr:hypothetical protein BY996DRAFT_1586702 [Phakopsora pachyrhizi]